MYQPLAEELRPRTLDEVFGQEEILGPGKVLRRMIESGNVPNLIFYGPSGTGKTTVANIIAERTHRKLFKLNATTASTADISSYRCWLFFLSKFAIAVININYNVLVYTSYLFDYIFYI